MGRTRQTILIAALTALTVLASGYIIQNSPRNTNSTDTDKQVYGYNTQSLQVNGYNITLNQTYKGYHYNAVIESVLSQGEYQDMYIRAGTLDRIHSRCDNILDFTESSKPYPCDRLVTRLKR